MAGRPQPAQTSSPNQERRWAKQNPLKGALRATAITKHLTVSLYVYLSGLRDTTAAQDVAPALAARKPQEPSTKPSKRPDAYEVSIPHGTTCSVLPLYSPFLLSFLHIFA